MTQSSTLYHIMILMEEHQTHRLKSTRASPVYSRAERKAACIPAALVWCSMLICSISLIWLIQQSIKTITEIPQRLCLSTCRYSLGKT